MCKLCLTTQIFSKNEPLTPPLDWGLMTVLVLVAFPDPHSELHEPQELHDDTWQSVTGEKNFEEIQTFVQLQIMCDFAACQWRVTGLTETKQFAAQPRFVTPLPVLQSCHFSPTTLANCQIFCTKKILRILFYPHEKLVNLSSRRRRTGLGLF